MNKTLKWTGIIATLILVVVLPLYTIREFSQQERLREDYYTAAVLSSTDLYAENCAICHGAAGEGIGENPALNTEGIQLMSASDLTKVIARGREGTQMAGWAAEEGGVFTNPQVNDLVTFVQQVNWEFVQARVAELGLIPPEVIQMEVSQEMLQSLAALPNGKDLSAGLMIYAENCAACHGGNGAGTIIAPAIDSAELRDTPKEDTIEIVNSGVAGTLMSSWQGQLSTDQISSVVNLIYSWPELVMAGIEFPEVEPISIPSSPELIAAGERLFSIACKSCHGVDGYGTPMAPALNNQIFLSEFPDAAIYQVIAGGVPDTLMPAWGSRLNDKELQSLVAFLRSWEDSAPAILPPVLGQ